jgi:hypothetical protein
VIWPARPLTRCTRGALEEAAPVRWVGQWAERGLVGVAEALSRKRLAARFFCRWRSRKGAGDRAAAVNFGQSLRRELGGEKFSRAALDSSELL